jgi:HlyD family secretion protein
MTTATLLAPRRAHATHTRAGKQRSGLFWLPLVVLTAAGSWFASRSVWPAPTRSPVPALRVLPIGVSALARLAPEGEVIAIAPGSAADGGRVDRLHVAVGDRVSAGQIIAVLDTHRKRAASVREAQAKVEIARVKLAQVLAGPKLEDVRAQESLVRKNQAELQAAEVKFERTAVLLKRNVIAQQEFDDERLKEREARESLGQSVAQLEAMKLVRPTDVKLAEADLAQSEAALAVASADLDAALIRSPVAGRVLRIHTRPGERVGDQGVVDVGGTDVMHAVAEVYEEDIGKVRPGQKARVRVPTLGAELSGEVVHKDLVVARKVVFNNDPVADTDARVVEVRIRLAPADSAQVAGLSNARAEVVIDTTGGGQ